MKTNHFFLGACLLFVSLLVSCTQPVDLEAVKVALGQYAEYTYKNYKPDGSAYFWLETDLPRQYQITKSDIYPSVNLAEITGDEKSKPTMAIVISMYHNYTPSNVIVLCGYYPDNNLNDITWYFGLETEATASVKGAKPSFALEDDEIYIENEAGQWIVLKKGQGLWKMGDKNGRSWTKMVV